MLGKNKILQFLGIDKAKEPFDRTNPFLSKIKERYLLTKSSSTKQTWHIALDLKDSGITFKVGDSFGIYPENDPERVEGLIKKMGGNVDVIHPRSGKKLTLKDLLTYSTNLSRVEHVSNLPELYSKFSPLLPRIYSVASSKKIHPEEVHFAVALKEKGVASEFLCARAALSETPIPIYLQPTDHFTLPKDPSVPIIMIGAGTGIAPFRAFMQERTGEKNWLFFGERNRQSDFFYQDFWDQKVKEKKLRLDLAFSRDQEDKCYVQHKIYENRKDFWQWIQEGANIYVCGTADPMAKAVESTISQLVQEEGNMDPEETMKFIKNLHHQKRLIFDVY